LPHWGPVRILQDTTEFMAIGAGDVIELQGLYYYVRGEESEGRFGLDGQPKFWVKRVVDLADGSPKILKLVFYEKFLMQLGAQQIRCFRSPRKEERILHKVWGDHRFMQGVTVQDVKGNPVRVIERIHGTSVYQVVNDLDMSHEEYFTRTFPAVFSNVFLCIEAIRDLHRMGEIHGDIRNDHIFVERGTAAYRWIDFDYTYEWAEQPFGADLFGLGNILLFIVGKGFHTIDELERRLPAGKSLGEVFDSEDFSLFFNNRLINLKKLFPYVPDNLNAVLMHFSRGSEVFYETAEEILDDLRECGF